jgi:hypothetical protein
MWYQTTLLERDRERDVNFEIFRFGHSFRWIFFWVRVQKTKPNNEKRNTKKKTTLRRRQKKRRVPLTGDRNRESRRGVT